MSSAGKPTIFGPYVCVGGLTAEGIKECISKYQIKGWLHLLEPDESEQDALTPNQVKPQVEEEGVVFDNVVVKVR